MPDTDKTDPETQENREEIKRLEATEHKPRGNVHSEPEDAPEMDSPPPLAH